MNYFDNINPRFFNIFASPLKNFYISVLFSLKKIHISPKVVLTKEMALDIIEFEQVNYSMDDTKKEVYSHLEKDGWLITEKDLDDTLTCSLTNNAILQLKAIEEMNSKTEVSLGGYMTRIIHDLKQAKEDSKPYRNHFQVARANTEILISSINKIGQDISVQIDSMKSIENPNEAYRSIYEFSKDFNDGRLYEIEIEENISTDRREELISEVEELENEDLEYFQAIIADRANYEKISIEEARKRTLEECEYILDCFDTCYDNIKSQLYSRCKNYMLNAQAKIKMFMSDGNTTSGKIERLLKILSSLDDNADMSSFKELIPLINIRHVNDESIKVVTESKVSEIEDQPINVESNPKEKISIKVIPNKYSTKYSNKFALNLLNLNDTVTTKDLNIKSREDFNQVIALILNAKDKERKYDIVLKDSQCKINGYTVPNFILKMKG